jgi:hypothetical protein
MVVGGAVVGAVASALVAVGPVAAQATGGESGGSDGFDWSEVIAAGVFVVAAVVVIAIGLVFARQYHERLLATIDLAVERGQAGPISTTNESALTETRTRGGAVLGVTGPATVEVGQRATFEATGADEAGDVTWSVEGGGAVPSSGRGTTFDVTFSMPGRAELTVARTDGLTATAPVEVVAAPRAEGEGVVLPFVIRNWARLVVVIFGVGAISALMALGVLSAEGGIGVLGALLGIGGASTSAESTSKRGEQ